VRKGGHWFYVEHTRTEPNENDSWEADW